MTFEELLNQGKAALAEKRAKEQAAEQAAEAERAFKQAKFDYEVAEGIKSLLPEALWEYIEIPETHVGQWDVEITIAAPDCAPIAAEYLPETGKLRTDRPYHVSTACEGGYYDWNELYTPRYDYLRSGPWVASISEALALAAEQYETMLRYESEYGLLLAEYEAKQAAKPVAQAPTINEIEDAPAAPTMADKKLEAIIRDMVRAEVQAYNEGGY